MPLVRPPISSAAVSARAWSRPVTTTSRPSSAYDCASSRPRPCVQPTMTTVPMLSPFALNVRSPPRAERVGLDALLLDRCRRHGRPLGQELALSEDVIPRLVELPECLLEIGPDELPVALHRVPGDE